MGNVEKMGKKILRKVQQSITEWTRSRKFNICMRIMEMKAQIKNLPAIKRLGPYGPAIFFKNLPEKIYRTNNK